MSSWSYDALLNMIQQANFEIFTQPTPQVHNNSTGTIALHNVLHIFSTSVAQTKATARVPRRTITNFWSKG